MLRNPPGRSLLQRLMDPVAGIYADTRICLLEVTESDSSEDHFLFKRHDIYRSIAGIELVPKTHMSFVQSIQYSR